MYISTYTEQGVFEAKVTQKCTFSTHIFLVLNFNLIQNIFGKRTPPRWAWFDGGLNLRFLSISNAVPVRVDLGHMLASHL